MFMKYLGIDYGEKRVGVAFSDEGGSFAFPNEVIEEKNETRVFARLKEIIADREIATVVIGLPLNFNFQETPQTKIVKKFGELLKDELGVSVVFENEILTTKEAEKSGATQKKMIDASSAALILQSFLDRR